MSDVSAKELNGNMIGTQSAENGLNRNNLMDMRHSAALWAVLLRIYGL